jgi:hypothetical protein
VGGNRCYWEREGSGNILVNGNITGNNIVTILATDVEFVTQGCGTWTPLPASGLQAGTFGNGIWAVGIQIAPGTYSAPGGANCS